MVKFFLENWPSCIKKLLPKKRLRETQSHQGFQSKNVLKQQRKMLFKMKELSFRHRTIWSAFIVLQN